MFASNLPYQDRKPKYISKIWSKHGIDGKRWLITPFPFLAPGPSCPSAIETPPRSVPAGPLISCPKNASCSRIASRASRAATMSDDMLSAFAPLLHCTSILQPATPPQVVAWHSWVLEQSFLVRGRTCSIVYKIVDNFVDDDDGFYYHTKWFSTLDWGSMRPNLLFWIWNYRWFAFTSFAFVFGKKKCFKEKADSPRSHPAS